MKIKDICLKFFNIFPIKKYIIMESNPDFSDNTKALFDVLIDNKVTDEYKIIWFVKSNKEFKNEKMHNVKFIKVSSKHNIIKKIIIKYYLYSAKIIIDSNSYIRKVRSNQFRLHLGHGMPLKNAIEYCRDSGEFDYILQLSNTFTDKMCNAYNIEKNKLLNLGYCRNDDLIKYSSKDIIKIEKWKAKKIIVWLPTYRRHKDKANNSDTEKYPYGIPCLKTKHNFEDINNIMKNNNILLLIKLHPAQDKSKLNELNLSNLEFITDDRLKQEKITLYQLLSKSTALITDYSSVYYDYLLTKKPIGLVIDDLKEYEDKFGFVYENYYDAIKGEYIYNFDDLKNFIINIANGIDKKKSERMWALSQYHEHIDDKSSFRVYEFLKKYL